LDGQRQFQFLQVGPLGSGFGNLQGCSYLHAMCKSNELIMGRHCPKPSFLCQLL
jgi:hypothetical protein